jgi:hypothetical protein
MFLSSISWMELKSRKWASSRRAPAFFFLVVAISLPGCDWKEILRPQGAPKKLDEVSNKAVEAKNGLMTAGEKLRFHRWIVSEMQEQIFSKPAKSAADIEGWANVLSQRGSMEGVYHGLILSSEYAALETGKAPTRAVRFFAQEMASLDFPNLNDGSPEVKAAREKYAQEHLNTPLFSLKRLLGEKVLKEANSRNADREGLAAWYSSFVARWVKTGVPFGLPQRDKPEEAFHYNWAKENNLGMIQWELLNRVHRVMNAYGDLPPVKPQAVIPAGK